MKQQDVPNSRWEIEITSNPLVSSSTRFPPFKESFVAQNSASLAKSSKLHLQARSSVSLVPFHRERGRLIMQGKEYLLTYYATLLWRSTSGNVIHVPTFLFLNDNFLIIYSTYTTYTTYVQHIQTNNRNWFFTGSSLHVQYVYVCLHVLCRIRTVSKWNFFSRKTLLRNIACRLKFEQILKNNSLPVISYIKRLGDIKHDVETEFLHLRNLDILRNKHGNLFHR